MSAGHAAPAAPIASGVGVCQPSARSSERRNAATNSSWRTAPVVQLKPSQTMPSRFRRRWPCSENERSRQLQLPSSTAFRRQMALGSSRLPAISRSGLFGGPVLPAAPSAAPRSCRARRAGPRGGRASHLQAQLGSSRAARRRRSLIARGRASRTGSQRLGRHDVEAAGLHDVHDGAFALQEIRTRNRAAQSCD